MKCKNDSEFLGYNQIKSCFYGNAAGNPRYLGALLGSGPEPRRTAKPSSEDSNSNPRGRRGPARAELHRVTCEAEPAPKPYIGDCRGRAISSNQLHTGQPMECYTASIEYLNRCAPEANQSAYLDSLSGPARVQY